MDFMLHPATVTRKVGAEVIIPFISLENLHVPVKEHIPGLISGSLF